MPGRRLKQRTVNAGGVTYSFNGLVEVMAKATPLRSGDELAGCVAHSDAGARRLAVPASTSRTPHAPTS
jgi:ethanolamine ammonia-lyase large subunit